MSVSSLVSSMSARWAAATRHPFLYGVGRSTEGSRAGFTRWLAQDVVFVRDLIAFQARLVARAPRSAQQILAEGVVGLLAELDWFDQQASTFDVELDAAALPATLAYRELLRRLDAQPYPLAIVGLWTLEQVYLDAWRYAGSVGGGGPFAAAVEHWTDPDFAAYVARLEQAADASLDDAEDDQVLGIVAEILDLERAFWDMAWSAPTAESADR